MKIYAAKASEIPDKFCESFFPLLDRRRLEKVTAIRHEKKRQQSICAGLLLRHAFLGQGYREEDWQRIEIAKNSYGKPYLRNYADFFYSLSHSGEWVLCAVDDQETGADIQKVGEPKIAVAKRFYAQEEYQRLLQYEPDTDRQTAEFYQIWAAKESCVKLTGRGIGAGVSRYVTDSTYTHIRDIEENSSFFIRLYEEIPGYMICVCSRYERFPESIMIIDFFHCIGKCGNVNH